MNTNKLKGTFHAIPLLFLTISLLFVSCGPGKKLLVSQARVDELQQDSANTQTQLTECYSKVEKLQLETASLKNENNSLSTESKLTIAAQAKRLSDLQNMIQTQKDVMAKLKNSIADALLNYKTDELSVYTKDGNVYVSLQEKLLFKSGSAVVDPKGKEALKSLAQVLNNTKDITVMIEGHTDNVPIKTNQFKDNWDLSTARATSIVRILTIDNAVDPIRILATGRSQFHPVKSNDTVEGRAGNRRTEVILSPDLKELYKLLYQ